MISKLVNDILQVSFSTATQAKKKEPLLHILI